MPDSRIVKGPKQSADVDDDDEADKHPAKELELRVDAASLNIIFGVQVVAPQHNGLQHVDAPDRKPAECNNHRHDEPLAEGVLNLLR
jgi:hypothetical protein